MKQKWVQARKQELEAHGVSDDTVEDLHRREQACIFTQDGCARIASAEGSTLAPEWWRRGEESIAASPPAPAERQRAAELVGRLATARFADLSKARFWWLSVMTLFDYTSHSSKLGSHDTNCLTRDQEELKRVAIHVLAAAIIVSKFNDHRCSPSLVRFCDIVRRETGLLVMPEEVVQEERSILLRCVHELTAPSVVCWCRIFLGRFKVLTRSFLSSADEAAIAASSQRITLRVMWNHVLGVACQPRVVATAACCMALITSGVVPLSVLLVEQTTAGDWHRVFSVIQNVHELDAAPSDTRARISATAACAALELTAGCEIEAIKQYMESLRSWLTPVADQA